MKKYRFIYSLLVIIFFLIISPSVAAPKAEDIIRSMKTDFDKENIVRSCKKIYDYLKAEKKGENFTIFQDIADKYLHGKTIHYKNDPLREILLNLSRSEPEDSKILQKIPELFEKLTTTWYLSERIPRLFDVKEIVPETVEIKGTFTYERGWPECVLNQLPGKQHSLHNLDRYIYDRVPREIVQDIIKYRRTIEFHTFPEELSFSLLRNRGYERFYQIHTVSGLSHKGLYLVAKKNGKDMIYVANRINGEEKLYHIMLMFRLAVIAEKSIPGNQTVICRSSFFDFDHVVSEYSRALKKDRILPETIIINYQNSILKELVFRKKARLIYEFWLEKFHGHVIEGLISLLKSRGQKQRNKILLAFNSVQKAIEKIDVRESLTADRISPKDVFQNKKYADIFSRIHELLLQSSKYIDVKDCIVDFRHTDLPSHKKSFFDPDFRYGITVSDGILNRSYFSYLDSSNHLRQAMVFRCVWGGDNIRALGNVLIGKMKNSRVKNFIHLGTAGSFDPVYGAGSIHVPMAIFDIDNRRVDINHKNIFTGFIKKHGLESGVKIDSRLIRVWSPLVENIDFLNLMRKNKYTTVEVEIAAIHDLFDSLELKLNIGEMVMITDLLGSEITLEQHGASNISLENLAFRKGFEYIVHYLDIADIP